jgi:3-deoxy-7-phosphoheptulonate synthase
MPVGVKHDNNGGGFSTVQSALVSIRQPMVFQAQLDNGYSGMYETVGNVDTFGILRGTSGGPNYTQFHTRGFHHLLSQKGLSGAVCVDLSHGNATNSEGKKDENLQMVSGADVAGQIKEGSRHIRAVMIEASMKAGKHGTHPKNIKEADPLLSLTDPCLGRSDTLKLLTMFNEAASSRFS